MPIELTPEFISPDFRGSKRGIVDDPIQFVGQAAQGIASGAVKVGYDAFSMGVGVGNEVNRIVGLPDDYRLDVGENYMDAQERLGVDLDAISPVSLAATEFTAFAITTHAAMARLGQTKRFGDMMRSSNGWTKFKGNLAAGAIADIGATALHSNKGDASLFELVPEQHRSDLMKWFVDRENNSDSEAMFKRILEDLALGGVAEGTLAVLGGAWRSMKATSHTIVDSGNPADMLDIADKVLGRGNGELRDEFVKTNTVVGSILDDGLPKKKRYTPVESLTDQEQQLANGTIHTGASVKLPHKRDPNKRGAGPPELDEQTIAIAAGVEGEVDKMMTALLKDPASSKEELKMAKAFMDDNTRQVTRLNINNSGAASIKGGLGTNLMLNLKSKFVKRAPRARAEAYMDAMTNLSGGTLGLKLKGFIADGAYDEDGVKKHLAMSAAMGYDVEEIIIASQLFRSNRATILQKQAKVLHEAKGPLDHAKMKEFVQNWEAIDYHDAGIQSVVGSSARIMNYQQVNPSDIVKTLEADSATARQAYLKKKGDTKPEKVEETALDYFSKLLTEGEQKEMKKVFKKLADSPSMTRKDMEKIVKGHDILDLFESFYIGSILSSPSTSIGSVGIGGAAMTAWKTLVQPTFEGVIDTIRRSVGGATSGAKVFDGLYNTVALWDTAAKAVPAILDKHRVLSDVIHTGFGSAREGADLSLGVMKTAGLKGEMVTMGKQFKKDGAYAKASLMTFAETIVAPVMGAQNMHTRFIGNIDDVYKGLTNEVILKQEARRLWHKEGGTKTFGTRPEAYDEFVTSFEHDQRAYIKIKKTITDKRKQNEAIKELFKDVEPHVQEATINSVIKAERIGAEATMQQDASATGIGTFLADMKRRSQVSPVTRFAYQVIVPFTKTPVNYLTEIIDSSPLAFTTARFYQKLVKGTAEEQLEVTAKIVAGLSLMGTIAYAVDAGTLSGTIEPNEREDMKALGVKEHSIYKDGTWYNYEKIGPPAALISSIANTKRLMLKDPSASWANISGQVLALAADNSHLATFSELMDIINAPNKLNAGLTYFFDKAQQSITPLSGAQRSLTDLMVNKRYRGTVDAEVGELAQELQSALVSGLKNNSMFRVGSDMVGAGLYEQDIDIAGNDVRSYSDTMVGKFLHMVGVGNTDHSMEPYVLEGVALGEFANNMNSNKVHGEKMTTNEYKASRKEMYHGTANAAEGLNRLVTSAAYKGITSDTVRKEVFSQALDVYKAYVNEITFAGSSRLQHEAYISSMFDIIVRTKGMKLDYGSDSYYKDVRMRKEDTNKDNAVTRRNFKEFLNQEKDSQEDSVTKEELKELLK